MIENGNLPPSHTDHGLLLQALKDQAGTGSAHPQHVRQHFLGQRKLFRIGPIVYRQKPPGTPLLSGMQAITAGSPGQLGQLCTGITPEPFAQVFIPLEFLSE